MLKVSKYTPWKVIGSYILLLLLSTFCAVLIYNQITQFIHKEDSDSHSNQKLFIISNILTGLYEAEAFSNAFVQTGSQDYFQKYTGILNQTIQNIYSLRILTTHEEQQLRIDSISYLLEKKIKNLQGLAQIKHSLSTDNFYNQAIAQIEAKRDSVSNTIQVRTRVVSTIDSSYVAGKKKRRWLFFKAKQDSVLKVSQSYHTIIDTLPTETGTPNTDSIVNVLKSTWEDLQKQIHSINTQINRKEYVLIHQSTHITEQLKRILGEYEKEEIYHTQYNRNKREEVISIVLHLFAWLAVAAVLFILFSTFFILRDLSNSQRYRKQLEEVNSYREKLILTITHDIKSPLSSIMGYVELINNTELNQRQRHFLESVKNSSKHILHLVSNLLDYSKLENNKMQLEEVTFNPFRLFQEIGDSFLPLAMEKQLELRCEIDARLNRYFQGDVLRIHQILSNLLSNGIKYTTQGSVSFTAKFQPEQSQVILIIQDTGTGMTEEEQKTAFKEFTRLSSNASGAEGTGLGLPITLKLIKLLKGKLILQSEINKGSCFTVTLPLFPLEEKGKTKTSNLSEKRNLKILLIDDDPLQLEMTSALLNKQNIQVETTRFPEEAIEKIKSTRYDVVFTDIQMPGLNGFELVKQIRAFPSSFILPVVALSADAGKTEKDYLAAGFSAYLGKPFTSQRLLEIIEQVTRGKKGYTLKNIQEFTDNDPKATCKIIHSFCSETEKHIELLTISLSEKNRNEISRTAHKMLPLFRQLEVNDIVELLEKLERSINNLSDDEVSGLTEQMIISVRALLIKLREEFRNV